MSIRASAFSALTLALLALLGAPGSALAAGVPVPAAGDSALTAGIPVPGPIAAAMRAALVRPDARVTIEEYAPTAGASCNPQRAETGPVRGSSRVAVRIEGTDSEGRPCRAWAWVTVRVTVNVAVIARPVAQGESLAGAVRNEERELRAGHDPVSAVSADAVATRALSAGQALEPEHLSIGPPPGASVTVRLTQGELQVERVGRRIPCSAGHFCATLSNGKRMEGRWDGRALWVEGR